MPSWLVFTVFVSFLLFQDTLADEPRISITVPTKQCYYPDGSPTNVTDYQPCNNAEGMASMCCAIANRGTNFSDTCLPNGLCRSGTATGTQLWRESCTDPKWQDPACLRICLSRDQFYDWIVDDAPVTMCEDGTVCCGDTEIGGRRCCAAGSGFRLPNMSALVPPLDTMNRVPGNIDPPPSSTFTIETSTGPPTGTSTPSPSPLPPPKNNEKAKIAISVSTAIAVSIVALAAAYIFRRCWARQTRIQPYRNDSIDCCERIVDSRG
ncbi:hypothetical protein TWF696_008252 [Orbilia brochopaga]|uniref:Uncharacterized protein n=1 Tax=Orbilia brochopaga TaxID=3140254 RepID=A0AAV9UG82_9PEZI